MSKTNLFLALLAAFVFAVGCNTASEQAAPGGPAVSEVSSGGGHSDDDGHDHADQMGHEATEVSEAIAELPAEERAAAEAQKICPVSGAALGSMGKPYKVTVKGLDVYLCCQGCEGAITDDPDTYLAKLDEKE